MIKGLVPRSEEDLLRCFVDFENKVLYYTRDLDAYLDARRKEVSVLDEKIVLLEARMNELSALLAETE